MNWCLECGEEFHDDDTGGYNPECRCGKEHCVGMCRSCCAAIWASMPDDDYEDEAGARSSGSSEETP